MRRLLIICLLILVAGCGGLRPADDWLQQLKDSSVVKRRQAVRELGARVRDDERIPPALVKALDDENEYVRRDAAVTLAKLGPAATRIVPALTAALRDKKRNVRRAAANSLKIIASSQTTAPARHR